MLIEGLLIFAPPHLLLKRLAKGVFLAAREHKFLSVHLGNFGVKTRGKTKDCRG